MGGRGKYAGQPHRFACAMCRKHPLFFESLSMGRSYRTTGKLRKQRSEGINHHNWPDTACEYECLGCGHVGWSRHPDVHRTFRQEHRRSTALP